MRLLLTSFLLLSFLASGCLTPHAMQEGEHSKKMGLAYLSEGSIPDAVSQFRAAVKHNRWDAEAWHGLGMAYFGSEKFAEAEEALLKALKLQVSFISPTQTNPVIRTLTTIVATAGTLVDSVMRAVADVILRRPSDPLFRPALPQPD